LRIGAAAILVVVAATFFWLNTRDRVSTDDAQVDGHIGYVSSRVSGSLQKEKTDYASGIINLARNIGGSSGIAVVTTMLARRTQFHQPQSAEPVSRH
jgi:hypothetical protein